MKRRNTVSVTPAIGAKTVAGAIWILPIATRFGTVAPARARTPAPTFPGLSQYLRTWLFYCLPQVMQLWHNLHHILMDEIRRTSSPESSALDSGKWIGRVVIAVILAEGIWGLIISVTNNLILPLLARTMGGDIQSPLYLGKGDFNVPALFTAVLQLCFAGIAAVILNSWVQRQPRVRTNSARVSGIPAQPATPPLSPRSVAPVQAASVPPPSITAVPAPAAPPTSAPSPSAPQPPSGQFWSPPEPARPKAAAAPPPPTKPAKPKPPKEVYYNIVGEPINPTEDD